MASHSKQATNFSPPLSSVAVLQPYRRRPGSSTFVLETGSVRWRAVGTVPQWEIGSFLSWFPAEGMIPVILLFKRILLHGHILRGFPFGIVTSCPKL